MRITDVKANRVIEDGSITILQPDLSKSGSITECLRIDVSESNRFRDDLVDNPGNIDKDGNVWPLEKPGLGLEVNEEFLAKHPPIEGPGYV